jgi:hypothetical protein
MHTTQSEIVATIRSILGNLDEYTFPFTMYVEDAGQPSNVQSGWLDLTLTRDPRDDLDDEDVEEIADFFTMNRKMYSVDKTDTTLHIVSAGWSS